MSAFHSSQTPQRYRNALNVQLKYTQNALKIMNADRFQTLTPTKTDLYGFINLLY